MHLIVLSIEKLSFKLFHLDSQKFDLIGKAFDFDSLEDDYEVDIVSKVGFLIVGKIGYAWSV